LRPLSDSHLFLTLTRLVVVLKLLNFRFALFTPPPSRRLSRGESSGQSLPAYVLPHLGDYKAG
jgi:hypothetical protein